MKLAVATPFLTGMGGMERVVLEIAKHYDATVHCFEYSKHSTFPDFQTLDMDIIPLTKLPFHRVTSAIQAGMLYANMKLDNYDVINTHQCPSEWLRIRNPNVLAYIHTPNREAYDLYSWRMSKRSLPGKLAFWASIQAFRFIEERTVPRIRKILTNSLNSQTRITKYLKCQSDILHPGINPSDFTCRSYDSFFLCPSRITPEKDIRFTLEAFRTFNRVHPDWKLIIAGNLTSPSYLKQLQSNLPPNTLIETNVTDERLRELYSTCTSVVYSPLNEDFGLVPLEAMASSKPCIGKNEGGLRETIDDSSDGFLVDTPSQMASRMSYFADNPDLPPDMGEYGRKKVLEEFTWDRFFTKFDLYLNEVKNAT